MSTSRDNEKKEQKIVEPSVPVESPVASAPNTVNLPPETKSDKDKTKDQKSKQKTQSSSASAGGGDDEEDEEEEFDVRGFLDLLLEFIFGDKKGKKTALFEFHSEEDKNRIHEITTEVEKDLTQKLKDQFTKESKDEEKVNQQLKAAEQTIKEVAKEIAEQTYREFQIKNKNEKGKGYDKNTLVDKAKQKCLEGFVKVQEKIKSKNDKNQNKPVSQTEHQNRMLWPKSENEKNRARVEKQKEKQQQIVANKSEVSPPSSELNTAGKKLN